MFKRLKLVLGLGSPVAGFNTNYPKQIIELGGYLKEVKQ